MKYLVLPAVLAVAALVAAPQAQAQSAAQLSGIQAACSTSGAACGAAIRALRALIAALPPEQRRAVIANIVAAVQTQAATATPDVLQNISAGLTELEADIDDPVQLAAVTALAAELEDGDIDDQAAFDVAVEDTIEQALNGGSPG
jgi:siroheme synthase (precorrin-2 oxidase/ferrochelatase)